MTDGSHILDPASVQSYVDLFNAIDAPEDVVNLVPNAQSCDWIIANVPRFECPEKHIEEIYYYRWWVYRKHLKQTAFGTIVTEFIEPVRHAGTFNSISCALGHHLAEGRWIRDSRYLDEYLTFWYRNENNQPEYRFHRYSGWVTSAALDRALVSGDWAILRDLLDDFVRDYELWETEKRREDGLFWQFDVWDGMEESISGSRKHKNARPTINSYMFANANAITQIAQRANRADLVEQFSKKAAELKVLVHAHLWDNNERFFKAQTPENGLSSAREAIGFIPWCFNLPDAGLEDAWKQLIDPRGFWAPFGITTAERRHPAFRTHGVGKCEWDGAVWPFATSQTLNALANVLRYYPQTYVDKIHYYQAIQTYTRCQRKHGKPYIGEYLDETTGEWLKGDNPRSRFYNHSTYCDLIISGLLGIVPREDDMLELHPLLPENAWDWFCLENVRYHGREVTIVWDRDGKHYQRGPGLSVYVDGSRVANQSGLKPLTVKL